jgi:WD40 repeat protein
MRINSFCFDSKGQNVVAAGQDGTIRVFDITNCKLMARWKAHEPGVAGVRLGSDDTTIYSVGQDSQVWSLAAPCHLVGQNVEPRKLW